MSTPRDARRVYEVVVRLPGGKRFRRRHPTPQGADAAAREYRKVGCTAAVYKVERTLVQLYRKEAFAT